MQVMFDTTPASIQHIRSGKLRPLAVTPANRVEVLPEVPTIGEFVPGYETRAWYGVGVPRNTPARIVELLNKEINAGLVDPAIKAKFFPIWAARCFPARLRILGKSSPVKQKNGGRS